jgi:hypothetical protein
MQLEYWLLGGVIALLVLAFAWIRRKSNAKKRKAKKRRLKKLQKPVKVSGEGDVELERIFPKLRHAWLKRVDGQGKVFVHFDAVPGAKDLQAGRVYKAKWGKSRRRKGRLDVVELSR